MYHILMVDDEPDLDLLIRQRFRREIQQNIYAFTFSRNGSEALDALVKYPDIQLVITDLNMPHMNGIELLIQLHKKFPHVQNMVISAYSDDTNVETARKAGAKDFLIKPVNFTEFAEKLKKFSQATT